MKRHLGKLLRVGLPVAIVAALVLFARTVDWSETWQAIRSTSPMILAFAAIANLISMVLKAVRWRIFLRPIGVPSFWLALRATFAGAAVNNILIANSGDAARVILVARAARVPSANALATLALERLFEIVGFVILLAAAVIFLALPPTLESTRPFALVALALVVGLLVYLVRHPEKADVALAPGAGAWHRVRAYGRRFTRTLTAISTTPRFVASLAITLAVWALQVASYQLTAIAAGFPISLVGTVAAVLAVNVGFAVRATPGNVGVFQVVYAVTAAAFGMDKDQAIGVALLIQMQQILPVTVLGLVAAPEMLFPRRRRVPETSILADAPSAERPTV